MKRLNLFKKGKNVTFNLIEVIIIVLVTGIIVSVSSGIIIFRNYEKKSDTNTTIKNDKLKEFDEVYNNIINSYVEDVNKDELIGSAINAMFDYLGDSYSSYYDSKETSDIQNILNGEYYGIGIEIINNEKNNVEITRVFENTPAYNAGLKIGDVIIKVNDEDVTGKTASYVASLIKSSVDDSISMEYKRNDNNNTLIIDLSNIIIPIADTEVYNDNIGYIKFSSFSLNSFEQFDEKLKELETKNIKSLIIDLRNNSGGYLNSAYEIADLFIEKDEPIYQLKKKDDNIEIYKAKDNEQRDYNIVVLINENSASASEVLTLALRESYGCTVIGMKSFGKGTVQEVEELSSGAMVKYTTAYWLSPKGNSINKTGISPDTVITNTVGNDEQLDKAIEILK